MKLDQLWMKSRHTLDELNMNFALSLLSRVVGWVVGWLGGVYELTLKLTSASTKVGVEVRLSLAKRLAFSLQVYHQVFWSRELLFLLNLKTLWVISTPSLELFSRKAKQDN